MALYFDAYKNLNGAQASSFSYQWELVVMGSGLSAPGNGSVGGVQVEFFYQSL